MGSAAALMQIPPPSDRNPHLSNTEGSLGDFLFKIVSFLPVLSSVFCFYILLSRSAKWPKCFVSRENGKSLCWRALSGYLAHP